MNLHRYNNKCESGYILMHTHNLPDLMVWFKVILPINHIQRTVSCDLSIFFVIFHFTIPTFYSIVLQDLVLD